VRTAWERDFAGLAEEYFPGSSQKISQVAEKKKTPRQEDDSTSWADSPRKYMFDGREWYFYSIGDLARALQKSPVTIRLWESQGYIPMPRRAEALDPSKKQRIYSRAQIEGIVQIAEEEGILGVSHPRISKTDFAKRVAALFLRLSKLPCDGAVLVEEAA
jgi:hypothetical protein